MIDFKNGGGGDEEFNNSTYYKLWSEWGYVPTHISYIKKLIKKIKCLENKLKKEKK
jgi:hypothetical protein